MPKSIAEVSIFGEYNQTENRLTAAFLQILKVGGEPLIREMAHSIGFDIPSSEIDILTQAKQEESVPDGQLECNFSFRLFIESKVGRFGSPGQLANHLKLVDPSRSHHLLYLTADQLRPEELPPQCHWMSWDQTLTIFRDYVSDTTIENYQLLSFLVDQYETLLNNVVHAQKKWVPEKDRIIVVAGARAEGVAIAQGYYICQNHRRFQNAEYMAFFKDNRISRLFRIDGDPKDDMDLRDIPELTAFLTAEKTEYNGEKQKVFRLVKFEDIGPIQNDSVDKNGNPCPYTYGQPRYTTLSKIRSATKTSQL